MWLPFVVAAASVGLSFGARAAAGRWLGVQEAFLFFVPAVAISALYGGIGPGVFATVVSAAISDYFFLKPYGTLGPQTAREAVQWSVFLLAGGQISWSMEALRAARRRSDEAQAVRERLLQETHRQWVELQAANAELAQAWEETKRAEAALRESDRRFRVALQHAGITVFAQDRDLRYIWAHNARFGFTEQTFLGRTDADIFPPDEARRLMEIKRRVIDSGQSFRGDVSLPVAGKTYTYDEIIEPVRDDQGHIVGLIGSAEDISERRQAEEAARKRTTTLAQAGELAHLGAWEIDIVDPTDINANPLSWSDEVYRIFGYQPGSVAVSNDLFFKHVHPDDRQRFADAVAKAVAERRDYSIEHRIIRPDGTERVVQERADLSFDESGTLVRILGAVQDITEQKLAQDALRRSEARYRALAAELEERVRRRTADLEAANKELEAFSYSVSHDLRAPLRSIDGFSKILLERYADQVDARGRDYLSRVRAASQRMAQLIDDILGLSRATRAEMRRGPVNLSEMAGEVLAELRKADPDRQVEAEIQPGVVANADPNLVRVVLDNLLGNAWKYTGHRPVAHIWFSAHVEAGERAYCIRDDGAGFDPAYADRLFTPFQRLHSEAEFPGTGIGLALVQRITRRHGGRVWAKGAVEKGATFCFTLGETVAPEGEERNATPQGTPG